MERVVISRGAVGILGMQVCAVKDATDAEILEVCNTENPSGTSGGWSEVVREQPKTAALNQAPVQCDDFPDRLHFLVFCQADTCPA
jgi:hypothetical protein